MNLVESVVTCFKKSFTFKGRASRSEYWYFGLLFSILVCSMFITPPSSPIKIPISIIVLLLAPAAISVLVRRLHDVNRSGWWFWIQIIPLVGLLLLYWSIKPSDRNQNEYGLPPVK